MHLTDPTPAPFNNKCPEYLYRGSYQVTYEGASDEVDMCKTDVNSTVMVGDENLSFNTCYPGDDTYGKLSCYQETRKHI